MPRSLSAQRSAQRTPIVVAVGLVAVLVLGGGVTFGARAYSQKKEATDCRDPKAPVDRRIEACASQCKANPTDEACRVRGELMVASDNDARSAEGIEVLRTTCNGGSAKACGALGSAFAFPPRSSIKRDLKQAVSYLQKGCAADAKQCSDLGVGKELGWEGINDDALGYYQRACDVADLYLEGQGTIVPKDPVRARKLYEDACAAGAGRGCNSFGFVLIQGLGGPKDEAKALTIMRAACEQDDFDSSVNLGFLTWTVRRALRRTWPRATSTSRRAARWATRRAATRSPTRTSAATA